jgi:hypothetical protein
VEEMTKTFIITFLMEQKYTVNIEADDAEEAEHKMANMPLVVLLACANRVDDTPFAAEWLSTEEKSDSE